MKPTKRERTLELASRMAVAWVGAGRQIDSHQNLLFASLALEMVEFVDRNVEPQEHER